MKKPYVPKYPIFESKPTDEAIDYSLLSDEEIHDIREAKLEMLESLRQINALLDKLT